MLTRNLLLGWTLLFLSACATRLAPLPPEQAPQLDALLRHTEIEGTVKTRNDAKTNEDLWNFAGEAEAALKRANNDKDLAKQQLLPVAPPSGCMKFAKALHLCK